MLHLKNNALTRREQFHRDRDARLDFFAHQPPLGIERRAMLALALEKVGDAFFVMSGIHFWRLIFRPSLPAAQLIQAHVGDDAVEPGIKATLEAEAMQVAVDLQESFLV